MHFNFPPGSPFEEFFKQFREQQGRRQRQQAARRRRWAPASSSIPAGYIVTNNHVVDGADEITVDD